MTEEPKPPPVPPPGTYKLEPQYRAAEIWYETTRPRTWRERFQRLLDTVRR